MAIKLDKNLCIGCGTCVAICPKSFKMNENELKAEVVGDENSECAKNSAESCPVQAIKVE